MAEYQKAKGRQQSMGDVFVEELREKKEQLQRIEERLRKFTEAAGVFGILDGNVRLATQEKVDKLKEIAEVEARRLKHGEMGATPEQVFAAVTAEALSRQDMLNKTMAALQEADQKVQEAEEEVKKEFGKVMDALRETGVMNPKQALHLKVMMARVRADAQILHNLEKQRHDPLMGVFKEIKQALDEMDDSEFLDDQAKALAELMDMVDEGKKMSGQGGILWLFGALDSLKYAELMISGKPTANAVAGEEFDEAQASKDLDARPPVNTEL